MCAPSLESDGSASTAENATKSYVCVHCKGRKTEAEMNRYYGSRGKSGISSVCRLCRAEQNFDCKQRRKHLEIDKLIREWGR